MAKKHSEMTDADHFEWWKDKLARMEDRTFALQTWGPDILDALMKAPNGSVQAPGLGGLGHALGVPLKFVPRGVASVVRLGIVTAGLGPSKFWVKIHKDRFRERKLGLHRSRKVLSRPERESIFEASGYKCGLCGKTFSYDELALDHLIPLSLLGADEPPNLVALCKLDNAKKWDRLEKGALKIYRRERVRKAVGVRFRGGIFWPVINGKPRFR